MCLVGSRCLTSTSIAATTLWGSYHPEVAETFEQGSKICKHFSIPLQGPKCKIGVRDRTADPIFTLPSSLGPIPHSWDKELNVFLGILVRVAESTTTTSRSGTVWTYFIGFNQNHQGRYKQDEITLIVPSFT